MLATIAVPSSFVHGYANHSLILDRHRDVRPCPDGMDAMDATVMGRRCLLSSAGVLGLTSHGSLSACTVPRARE